MNTNQKSSFYDKPTIFAALSAGVVGLVNMVKGDGTEGVLWFLLMLAWFIADDIQRIRKSLAKTDYAVTINSNAPMSVADLTAAMRAAKRSGGAA